MKPQLIKTDRLGDIELSDAVKKSDRDRSEPDITSRAYVPGDDRRYINWSQYARTGVLMTRELTGSDHSQIAVITDTYRYSSEQAEYLPPENRILETVLAVSYYYCRNNICAAEYHLHGGMVCLTAENTHKFGEFYNDISEIIFNSHNTHQLLYESVMCRRDIFDSAAVFFILSSWDAHTDALLGELERNGLGTVVCYITDNENDAPDLSHHKSSLVCFSPYRDMNKEGGA